jgi:hypothetical protein
MSSDGYESERRVLDSNRRRPDPAGAVTTDDVPDDGFVQAVARVEASLRARVTTTELEVEYAAGVSATREVGDQYGTAYVTETTAWALAWAPGPDGATWQLYEREYQRADAVHTAGTSGSYRTLLAARPVLDIPTERRRSATAGCAMLLARADDQAMRRTTL